MCEYRGSVVPSGASRRISPDPRAVDGWPCPRTPAAWVLRQVGEPGVATLVTTLFALLQRSAAGYRLPAGVPAREDLVARATAELLAACRGEVAADRWASSAFLVGFRGTADLQARAVWLDCLKTALRTRDWPAATLRELWGWFEPLSARMTNLRVTRSALVRYPYPAVARELERNACH